MTHTHFDHISALIEVKEKIPWAEVWIHALEGEPLENGDERTVYGMDMFEQICQSQYHIKPGTFNFKVDRKLKGGENLNIRNEIWEIIHIPGHSHGSIGLYNLKEKILIPGDVLYADFAIGRFDLFGANRKELKKSLETLTKYEINILLPGHNRIVKKVPTNYVLRTLNQWDPYLS